MDVSRMFRYLMISRIRQYIPASVAAPQISDDL